MSKKVLATNCRITTLPDSWEAKIDGNGTAIITVTGMMVGMFGGIMSSKSIIINGFTATSFDEESNMKLVGAPADFDESDFYEFA